MTEEVSDFVSFRSRRAAEEERAKEKETDDQFAVITAGFAYAASEYLEATHPELWESESDREVAVMIATAFLCQEASVALFKLAQQETKPAERYDRLFAILSKDGEGKTA